jgi:PKD repeat protein
MKTLAITFLVLFTLTAHAQRGRVLVQNGSVVADNGQLLRGEHLLMRPDNVGRIHNENWYRLLRDQYHLNTIRLLCYRDPINIPGYTCDPTLQCMPVQDVLPLLDSAVAITGRLGMYAIIDYHPVGGLNTQECANWWSVVAPRYKDETHVLYEAANEPGFPSNPSFQTSIYNQLRAVAPNTHIILWSFEVFQNTYNGFNVVNQVENGPALSAYSNASMGFHSYGSVDGTRLAQLRSAGYPAFMTERQWNSASLYQGEVQVWENSGISWVLLSCYPRCTDLTQWQINCTDMHGNYFAQMTISWPRDSGAVDQSGQPNVPPNASFTAAPQQGLPPLSVTFDATASSDPDGMIVAYHWRFGDGATGSGAVVQHEYASQGTYVVVLTVTDNRNGIDTATGNITVLQPLSITQHPVNQQVVAGQSATFSVSAVGVGPLSYQWKRNGNAIPGATGSSYTVTSTTLQHNGDTFRCAVSGTAGTVVSNEATLTVNPPPPRVSNGLLALYTFREGSGTSVYDVSGVGSPINLTIKKAAAVSWVPEGLSVHAKTTILSTAAPTKITSAVMASNEITMEAWIRPANTTQTGPARIVTLSQDKSKANFVVGQTASSFDFRLRTTKTNEDGTPSIGTNNGVSTTALTHVVYTRRSDGDATVYLNGVHAVANVVDGTFSNWATNFSLGIANEPKEDRPWFGVFSLVAIYGRALSADEVSRNFNAGSINPGVSDYITVNTKAILEGPFDIMADTMRTSLAGVMPLAQPYASVPWSYTGSESVGALPPSVVDWILVELRTGPAISTAIARRAGFLKSNGAIVDLDGYSPLRFHNLTDNHYHIAVRHRNHLTIVSAAPVALSPTSGLYDFRAEGSTMGTGNTKRLGAIRAVVAGDVDSNGGVGASDLIAIRTLTGTTGYVRADADLNGGVGASDLVLARSNVGSSSPQP